MPSEQGCASETRPNLTVSHIESCTLERGASRGHACAMDPLPPPLAFLLLLFSGWVNRQQLAVIDYPAGSASPTTGEAGWP